MPTGGRHPLSGVDLHVKNFKCFAEEASGFEKFEPINIIIGRNNSGKSGLIDVVDLFISKGKTYEENKHARRGESFEAILGQALDEGSLKRIFPEEKYGGSISTNTHWDYGKQFVGERLERGYGKEWQPSIVNAPSLNGLDQRSRQKYLNQFKTDIVWPLEGVELLRISAERDIQPEDKGAELKLRPNGVGATNLIRAFINSDALPREEVEDGLLGDLNVVYLGDCAFSRITCQENDQSSQWEIYIREEEKGDIRLSQSGSSLKSIFIILSMLRLVSFIEKIKWNNIILAIEEPENNLHPALLRRLLNFLAAKRDEMGFNLIVTTHSPTCIDWSARRTDSQIIHVQHDGRSAHAHTATTYLHNRNILDDLEIRASDILQANSVIWVEGPSDRIYLRRWLDIASDGYLKEGTHYTIMFYGGKLLFHLDALPPDESDALVSLISINRNAAIVIDSDRHPGKPGGAKPRMRLNETKKRIKDEVTKIGGYVWITAGREVENYTPIDVFARVCNAQAPKVDCYTQIPKLRLLKNFKENKVAIAHAVAPETQKADLVGHLDIWQRLEELCAKIKRWNGLTGEA